IGGLMSNSIQELCREYRGWWEKMGQWVEPVLDDALMFAVTEIGEAMDARLRQKDFVRNNQGEGPSTALDVGLELFDVVLMCCVALDCLDMDLMTLARQKLAKMDRQRREVRLAALEDAPAAGSWENRQNSAREG
ncbi:MAG: hypothetical protein ABIH46_02105, partial [Chloroflexota bacterium]